MNAWQQFLTEQAAVWHDDKLVNFLPSSAQTTQSGHLVPMVEHALLIVEGPDAQKFLQGQVTCDVRRLEQNQLLLGAHCNPQGRMISSFTVFALTPDTIALRLRRDIAETALAALKKYLVFSKAKASLSAAVGMILLPPHTEALKQLPPAGTFANHGECAWLHHGDGAVEIWADIGPAQNAWTDLAKAWQPAPPAAADLHWIQQGVAEIQAPTQEKFVPQHFNFQLTDGISFKKGCYTGQEIIARIQYRGQVKKHVFRATLPPESPAASVGDSLESPSTGGTEKGLVVAAAHYMDHHEVLVAMDRKHLDLELSTQKSAAKLTWAALPYAIPKE